MDILWSSLNSNALDGTQQGNLRNQMVKLLSSFDVAFVSKYDESGEPLKLVAPEFEPEELNFESWPPVAAEDQGSHIEIQRWIAVDKSLPHGLLKRIQVGLFNSIKSLTCELSQTQIVCVTSDGNKLYLMTGDGVEGSPGICTEGLRLHIRSANMEKKSVGSAWSLLHVVMDHIG